MTQYWLVTVKLPKNQDHNPKDKKTGPCPVSGMACDDVTGEHHTVMASVPDDKSISDVRKLWSVSYHVTRVERIILP